jgi:hypothetical protein
MKNLHSLVTEFAKTQGEYKKDAEIMAVNLTNVLDREMEVYGFRTEFSKSGLGYSASLHIHDDGATYLEGRLHADDDSKANRAALKFGLKKLIYVLELYGLREVRIYHVRYYGVDKQQAFFRASMKI